MNISNLHSSAITIESVLVEWVEFPASQKLDKLFLNGTEIWNISDNFSPSDIPSEGNWNGASRQILLGNTANFVLQFLDPLAAGDYSVSIVFNINCQVSGSFTAP